MYKNQNKKRADTARFFIIISIFIFFNENKIRQPILGTSELGMEHLGTMEHVQMSL